MKSLAVVALLIVVVSAQSPCLEGMSVPGPYTGQMVIGNTEGAPVPSSSCNSTFTSGGLFYSVVSVGNGAIRVSTCNAQTEFDTIIAVFEGDSCDDLQCVGVNDDSSCEANGLTSEFEFNPQANRTYWVMVTGYSQSSGQFGLTFTQEPSTSTPTSSCENASVLRGPFIEPLRIFGVLDGAQEQSVQPCDVNSSTSGVWYEIFPTEGSTVTVSTCGDYDGFDTILAVLSGPSCGMAGCAGSSDDACDDLKSRITFTATEQSYYIYLTGYGAASGNYYLTISEDISTSTQPGETCLHPIELDHPGLYLNQTNIDGLPLTGACSVSGVFPATWYHLSLPSNATATITTCSPNTSMDTILMAFDSCDTSSCVAYNDDDYCRSNSLASTIQLAASDVPRDIFVAVSGYQGTTGFYDLIARLGPIRHI